MDISANTQPTLRTYRLPLPPLISLAVLLLWALGSVWGHGYALPRWHDALANGYAHQDTLFFAAFAAMLQTYGIPSTGIDGLPSINYHYGSHWLGGQIANVGGVSTLTVYNQIFPLILPAVFILSFVWFVIALKPRCDWKRSSIFWLILIAGIVRLIPQPVANLIALHNSSIISESNSVAFSLFFMTAALLARGAWRHRWFLWGVLPLACFAAGASKQSVLYLAVAVLGYLFLRFKGYRRGDWWVAAVLVMAACIPAYLMSKGVYAAIPIEPFQYVNEWVFGPPLAWFVLNFGWSWLYIGVRASEGKIRSPEVGIVATLCFAGMIPALLLNIPDGSAAYFVDLQRFVAVAFLVTWIPERLSLFRWQRVALVFVTILAALNIIISVVSVRTWSDRIPAGSSAVLDQLDQLAKVDNKAETGLYIPSDHPYWSLLSTKLACNPVSFVAPAYTGMALVGGISSPACRSEVGYGYKFYTEPFTGICDRARQYGLTRVLVLESVDKVTEQNCLDSPGS